MTAAAEAAPSAGDEVPRASAQTLARLRLDLSWQSQDALHTETRVLTRVDLWRDILPPELEAAVMGQPVGHRASQRFAPGTLVEPRRDDLVLTLSPSQLPPRLVRGDPIQPRRGRFYPRGLFEGAGGLAPGDRRPLRVVECGAERLILDLNHPLAGRALELRLHIEGLWPRGEQRGGRCADLAELITADGPGMQARQDGQATDFWSDHPFRRLDPRPDDQFYTNPRLVDHLDRAAIAEVSALYGRLIKPGSRILDLMTSWRSHLDPALAPVSVVGLGMSRAELDANPMLTERLVHDLNRKPVLPFADESFDAVICTVSVEYLTRPFEVFRELARVLAPGGRCILTFSNRWFPPKVIRVWQELHDFERLGLVLDYCRESGRFTELATWSLRGLPRPPDDKYADRLADSDPVYAVWATRL